MQTAWSYILAVLLGATFTVVGYETSRLLEDTSKALTLASATLNEDAKPRRERGSRAAAAQVEEPAAKRRAKAAGGRAKARGAGAKPAAGRAAANPEAGEKTERPANNTRHRVRFKMTDSELRLLKQRRAERAGLREDLRAETVGAPLPVGEVKLRPNGRGPRREPAVEAELYDDQEGPIDTGLPVLPQ